MNTTHKPSTFFWIIGILSLLWNSLGAIAYIGQAYITDQEIALMPKNEQELFLNTPSWVTAAFAIAVFGAVIASILFLVRKKIALLFFVISLLGIIAQMSHNFFLSNAIEVYGIQKMILPVMIVVVGVFLVWFTKKSINKHWLN